MAEKNLTYQAIAKDYDIDRNTIRGIVEGTTKDPGLFKVLSIFHALGLDASDLQPNLKEIAKDSQLDTLMALINTEPLLDANDKDKLKNYIFNTIKARTYRVSKIMVVDDEEIYRLSVEKFLEKNNYTVSSAETTEAALKKIKQDPPDLVIIDIMFNRAPKGLALLKKIKAEFPDVQCIMLSFLEDKKLAHESIEHGAFDYINKDQDLERIIYVIKKIEEVVGIKAELRSHT